MRVGVFFLNTVYKSDAYFQQSKMSIYHHVGPFGVLTR